MALNSEEKLKNFADEAMGEAKKISGKIEQQTKSELTEKVSEGEKKISARISGYISHETENIKKEQALAVSQAEIQTKQDYFKFIDSLSARVLELASEKLGAFTDSGEYGDYLFDCCKNVMEKVGTDIDIFYRPCDEGTINAQIKKRLAASFDISQAAFMPDETIKAGGLRFFCRSKNVFVNDVFEEKAERAKELLHSIIGPLFAGVK